MWTVDMDLEKFFDTVNQSKLMEILARDITDGRVLSLIHKYLRAGAVWCGRFEDTEVGVPQGGPLSPLCANIMLNELDHELERRGHSFVRYADDMVIFCGSKASAEQTLEHIVPRNAGILANSRKGYWRIASSPILQTAFSNQRREKAEFQFFYSYYRKSVAA